MLHATPFDLCMFTGDGISPTDNLDLQRLHSRYLFTWYSQQINNTNQRFRMNPALRTCRLVLPMTENLFLTLQNTPSWQAINGHAALREHKALVLRFLIGQNQQGGSPILDIAQDNTYLYTVIGPEDFFPPELPITLQAMWSEASGACIFSNAQAVDPTGKIDINACLVISPGRGRYTNQLTMMAQNIYDSDMIESQAVPMISIPLTCPNDIEQFDFWPWEQCIRNVIWQDERLPFYGPGGPFGFRPNANTGWKPGQRPCTAPGSVHGYMDEFGGIWQWECGRAALHTPFEGHWNVQLAGPACSAWENHIGKCLNRRIRLLSNHVNIEADGSIVDYTFHIY